MTVEIFENGRGRPRRRVRDLSDSVLDEIADNLIDFGEALDVNLVRATPVDTGRARSNWRWSASGFKTAFTENTSRPQSDAPQSLSRDVFRRTGRLFLANNAPYIGELDRGSSRQAPAMFVGNSITTAIRQVFGD